MYLAAVLDCYGEDYPELFLDVHGDIRVDVAVRLGETAARVVDGQLSLWELSEIFEEWMGITVTFMALHRADASADINASAKLATIDRSRSGSASSTCLRSQSETFMVLVTSTACSPSCSLDGTGRLMRWSSRRGMVSSRGAHRGTRRTPCVWT